MGSAPLRPCPTPGCRELVSGPGHQLCEQHRAHAEQAYRRERRERAGGSLYHSVRWRKARASYLAEFPVCAHVDDQGRRCYAKATVVDHIQPHHGDEELFSEESNWQGLCASHHTLKTRAGQ